MKTHFNQTNGHQLQKREMGFMRNPAAKKEEREQDMEYEEVNV